MKRLFLLHLSVACLTLGSSTVYAASTTNGMTVAPAIEQVVFGPDDVAASFTARITNNTGADVTVAIIAQDFAASDRSGGIRFLDPNGNNLHSLVPALTIGQSVVFIAAGQTTVVPVTISNIKNLAPGGHYAAIVYQVIDTGAMSGNTVNVKPAVSTLVFASTTGNGMQAVKLATPIIGVVQSTLPSQLNVAFGNTGNTQTTLRGVVQVYGPDNRLVSQGIINVDSGLILPGSTRLFSVDLGGQAQGLRWPGFYYVRVAYRHDGQAAYAVYQKRFLYISVPFIIGCITLIIVLGVVLRRLILRRIYPLRNHR